VTPAVGAGAPGHRPESGAQPRALLVCPEPGEDEVLSSWLTRLALRNRMRLPRLLAVLGHPEVIRYDLDFTTPDEVLRELAIATRQPVERVLATSLRELMGTSFRDVPIVSPRSFLVYQGRGNGGPRRRGHPVCLSCLAQTGQVRRRWRLITTVICPVHQELLVDGCPYCGEPINLVRTQKQRATLWQLPSQDPPSRCRDCGREMQAVSEPPTAELISASRQVQSWVDQALSGSPVLLPDVQLPATDFVDLLTLLLTLVGQRRDRQGERLQFPPVFTVRPFEQGPMLGLASPEIRLPVVARAGYLLRKGLVPMLWTLVEAEIGVRELVIGRMRTVLSPLMNDLLHDTLSKRPHGRRLLPMELRGTSGRVRFTAEEWEHLGNTLPISPPGIRSRRIGDREVLEAWLTWSLNGETQGAWAGQVGVLTIQRRLRRLMDSGHLDPFLERSMALLEDQLGGSFPGIRSDWAMLPDASLRLFLALLAPATTKALHLLKSRSGYLLWMSGTRISLIDWDDGQRQQ